MINRILIAVLLLAPAAAGKSEPYDGRDCSGLTKLKLDHATVTQADDIPKILFNQEFPHFCRVRITSKPTPDSDIKIEVWLPRAAWNGKFYGVGNGGFAGKIEYDGLALALRTGYAAASTDTGHEAGMVDAAWALGHPEKIVDFGHRAVHEMTVAGKAVAAAYYKTDAKKSYFNGCSNGGRQALMEAQRYPADYDGILAGAPANYWTHLLANSALNSQALFADPASYIPARKLPAIEALNLTACDAQDGVKDGVLRDPSKCHLDLAKLLCKGADTDTCLTAPQLKALKQLYEGTSFFPGYPPGGEADKGGWDVWITGPAPQQSLMFGFSTQFYKNMQFSNPAWDFRTFQPARDVPAADEKMAGTMNATNADLSAFQAHGGKLVLWHGWNDPAIAAPNTIHYYRSVQEKLGTAQAHQFIRLFLAPGMLHCAGGKGPIDLGQFQPGGAAPTNIEAAMEAWVDKGIAPEQVMAVKRNAQGGVLQSRPICAYPLVAKYKGSGSTDDAANFICGN